MRMKDAVRLPLGLAPYLFGPPAGPPAPAPAPAPVPAP